MNMTAEEARKLMHWQMSIAERLGQLSEALKRATEASVTFDPSVEYYVQLIGAAASTFCVIRRNAEPVECVKCHATAYPWESSLVAVWGPSTFGDVSGGLLHGPLCSACAEAENAALAERIGDGA